MSDERGIPWSGTGIASMQTDPAYYIEARPWGEFRCFGQNIQCTAKVLILRPRQALSVQFHQHRDQHYYVMGKAFVEWSAEPVPENLTGSQKICEWWQGTSYREAVTVDGDEFFFPRRHIHRVTSLADTVRVFEVAYGVNDEMDIVRIDDLYGREE